MKDVIKNFNLPIYVIFMELTQAPPPLFVIPNVYDVVIAFMNDLYDSAISYGIFKQFFSDNTMVQTYLAETGIPAAEIKALLEDRIYGWSAWQTLKIWVQAVL